jgi:hypothetical protein
VTDVPTAPRPRAAERPVGDPSTPTAGDTGVVRRPARPPAPPGRFEQLVVPPDTGGPRVRLGFLWFFLALAAVTSGRWWTAALAGVVAAAAGYQTTRVWAIARAEAEADDDRPVPSGAGRLPALLAALLAASVPVAAGYGTGAAGAAMLVVSAVAGLLMVTAGRATGATVAIAALLPALGASSIVLALQVDLWVALFLVLTVSLYDAGNFALGADATGRWEGPVGGVLGALAVTFTMATIQVPPLDRAQWWIAGAVVAGTCAAGQWLTSYFLPEPTAWVPALRRLDAYLVAGPTLVATMWALGA